MQKLFVVGNLGQDAELKVFGDGNSVLNFSVASTEKWNDKSTGERKERTEWFRCKMGGKRANALAQYLTKGTKVAVTGSLETRTYEKDGVKHYATDVRVQDVEFCGGGNKPQVSEDPDGLGDPGADGIPF